MSVTPMNRRKMLNRVLLFPKRENFVASSVGPERAYLSLDSLSCALPVLVTLPGVVGGVATDVVDEAAVLFSMCGLGIDDGVERCVLRFSSKVPQLFVLDSLRGDRSFNFGC
jgi:hypothetical protein